MDTEQNAPGTTVVPVELYEKLKRDDTDIPNEALREAAELLKAVIVDRS